MYKPPGTVNSKASSNNKSAGQKTDVVSVACQTDNNTFGSGSSSPTYPSLSQDSAELIGMVERNANTPSSNAAEQRAAANSSSRDGKQQASSEPISEGTISMTIGKFSTLSDTMCSGPKRVQGVPWRIMVMPKQHVVQKKQQKCMGFFLQCCPEKVYSDSWSCKADAEMRLMSKKQGINNFVRKTSHIYTSKENDWGYSCFMTWADVLDENQGYIKDDKITLEITVRAEPAKNLMSREEFVKAIDQWYNLAEMQMNRGMIDLSLEANAQGLKFCKDKDDEMKTKLEEQKQRLVKKKVLDSINRIENHGGQPKSSEPLKPTSLRQALTGAQKTIVSKNGKAAANKRDRKTTLQQIKKKKQETAAKQEALKKEGKKKNSEYIRPSSPDSDKLTDCSESEGEVTHPGTPPRRKTRKEHNEKCFTDLAEASTSDEGEDDGEDEDYSDYYNEDEIENQLSEHDEGGSIRGSSSSLEQATALSDKVESSCQTDFTGEDHECQPEQAVSQLRIQQQLKSQPQAIPRRERISRGDGLQMHFILRNKEPEDDFHSDISSSPDSQRPAGQGASPSAVATRFQQELTDENSALYKTIGSAQAGVTEEDHAKIDAWCMKHFGDVPKDMATCGLTIGLCSVNARRCAEASREFRKLISATFRDEVIEPKGQEQCLDQYRTAAKMYLNTEKMIAKGEIARAGFQEAIQKHNIPPGDFTLDLARDSASGQKVKKSTQKQLSQSSVLEQVLSDEEYQEKVALYPVSECERSIEQLVKEMGPNKFDVCIAEKLQNTLTEGDYNSGLLTLLTQLFNYFRTLTEQKYELQKSVEIARALYEMKTKNGGLPYQTQLVLDSEKRITESQELVKKLGATYQAEQEKNKKLEDKLLEEQQHLKAAQKQVESLTQQLKDARNGMKKAEKKAKQEETKNATLLADKLDLEDKLKTAKKEMDQMKKKSTEERNNAKKQKDRDTEIIRRLENENAEKEAEKEREKCIFEEKLRDARTKENKAEKERKQALSNLSAANDRARAAEAAQVPLLYAIQQYRFDKAQEEVQSGLAEAEKNLKRTHSSLAEQESLRKNFGEWKAASDELEKIIKETKTEYDNAQDLVKKGQILFSQLELSQPTLPALPKTIRPPPVQVVQPSTSTIPPPTIVTPPAGVIGQPRVSGSGAGVIGQPPSSSSRTQVNGPSINNGIPGPSSYNSMKLGHESSGQSISQTAQQLSNPASSPWNWSISLETITGSVFGPRNPAMEHARQQPLGIDNWPHQDDYSAQSRSMYSTQQGQAMNWASAPGWQRPGSASMAQQQQQQYGRSGLPPYYQ